MERLLEIKHGIRRERERLSDAHESLVEECGRDRVVFARRWHAIAHGWRFDELNELIRTHNEWYPVERDFPMDLRTRDYGLVNGRSYRAASSTPPGSSSASRQADRSSVQARGGGVDTCRHGRLRRRPYAASSGLRGFTKDRVAGLSEGALAGDRAPLGTSRAGSHAFHRRTFRCIGVPRAR